MRLWIVVCILLAGCTDPASPDDVAEPGAAQGTPATEIVRQEIQTSIQVDWNGTTKEGAWVCPSENGTSGCQAGQQVQPDGGHTTTIAYGHNVTAIGLILRWDAADASQTGLVMAVYGNTSNGPSLLGSNQGDSPLRIDVSDPPVVADDRITIVVWPEGKTPTQPSLFVDATRQPFHVVGHIDLVHTIEIEVPVEP